MPSLVAVEFDLYSDRLQGIRTVRLCNRGPLFSRLFPGENYEPRLNTPINLGTTISFQSYGQPLRALDNQGVIEFKIGNEIVAWQGIRQYTSFVDRMLDGDLHWIGGSFRVYEGERAPNNFVEELELVYSGRVTDVSHDTKTCSVRTGDASIDLDNPLVSDLYPVTSLPSIASKPRPLTIGTVFCIEPVLVDEINLIYEASNRPIDGISDSRVGGISWPQSLVGPPGPGEWFVNTTFAHVEFGSDLLGGDVRCDVSGEEVTGLGALISKIASRFNVPVDEIAMQTIDDVHRFEVGYYARDAVNGLAALDDIVTGCGCWWGITATGLITGGFVGSPADTADVGIVLDNTNILSISLSRMLPPAWRVPVEFERHWQVQGQFFEGVDENDKQRWSSSGLKVSRQDDDIKIAETRAYDVPTMRSVVVREQDANVINDIFWEAWSVPRHIVDCTAWVDVRELHLYGTIAVNYMMFQKNYRIISAVPSIGGGPAQLQLWG